MNHEQIARVCHAANRAYCETLGDFSEKRWAEADEWQRQSFLKGVAYALERPDAPASAQHEAWLAEKQADGWGYGPVKDAGKKEHPCFVSYARLPLEQRLKDYIFQAIVHAFAEAGDAERG